MPTYSYRCRACSDAFDIHQAFSDDTLTICPACGGELRKVFSPVGVSFTGSGFYRNDSRAKPESGAATATTGGKESSGESKSEKSEKSAPAVKEKAASSAGSSGSGPGGNSGGSSGGRSGGSSAKKAAKSSDK